MKWTIPRFSPPAAPNAAKRFPELDGFRGWAALSVVLFHIFWETFGVLFPWIRNPVTRFLLDGGLAVSVFFVLSGEALSAVYFAGKGRKAVVKLAARRYTRLAIPVFVSTAIVALLMALHWTNNVTAGALVHRSDWLGLWLHWPVTIGRLLKFSFFQVFGQLADDQTFDVFLWTMKIELIGSMIVFALLLALHKRSLGFPLLVGLGFVMLAKGGNYALMACFVAGMCFGAMRQHGVLAKLQTVPRIELFVIVGIFALALIDDFVLVRFRPPHGISLIGRPELAIALAFFVFTSRSVCAFLARGISQFLGKVSFPLYLMQFPILVSYTSWLIIMFSHAAILNVAGMVFIGSSTLLLCVLGALAFEPVETLTSWVGRKIDVVTLAVFEKIKARFPAAGSAKAD